jgi:DNA-binding MarR family transcriptional regulator
MRRSRDSTDVVDLLERTSRLLQNSLYAEGLPPAQWQTLRYLSVANRFSCTPSAIGHYLGATKGTVSQTIIALVRKGLVTKKQDPADRRSVSLRLTARGQAQLVRHPLSKVLAAIGALPAEARRGLAAGLSQLLGAMIANQNGRPFGQCRGCRFFQSNAERGTPGGPHRCGLLAVPLSDDDAKKICVEFDRAA